MSFRYVTGWLLLATILLSTGCGDDRSRSGLPQLEEMNVLLIVIDTLRADDLGCFTPGLDISPRIDALAENGVLFRRAIAPAPWTQPSIASLLTGLTPSHHGSLRFRERLARVNVTLAERFKERDFFTAAVVSHTLVRREFGYGQGFDFFDESSISPSNQHSGAKVTRVAVDQLRRMQNKPFFMFVHYFDPHYEYLHHEEFDRTSDYDTPVRNWSMDIGNLRAKRTSMTPNDLDYLHDLYREEIAFNDQQVGILLDELEDLELSGNTLVILAADHGEEFGEHEWIGHTRFLYDTLLHVPLVFSLPGRLRPREVEAPVSLIDIVPTLEALAIAPAEAKWDGRSLLDLLGGSRGDSKRGIFSEVAFVSEQVRGKPRAREKDACLTALRSGDWKLIHDLEREEWELYSLRDDPGEKRNLYSDDHQAARRLRPQLIDWERGKVDTWGRDFNAGARMTDEEREHLRSLGYIH